MRKKKVQLGSFEKKTHTHSRAKSSIRINCHRILIINLHYKKHASISSFVHERRKRMAENHQLYFVYSDNDKKPFIQRYTSNVMSLSLPQIWWFIPSLSPQRSMKKKLLSSLEKGICFTILLPFMVSRIKQASSWKFCIIWKKKSKKICWF